MFDNPCPVCGHTIPERPRGSRHGHPPKTCSEACRKERNRRIERARYYAIKDTDEWKATRNAAIARHKKRLASDADYALSFRAASAERTREYMARLKATNPAAAEKLRLAKIAWHKARRSDPNAYSAIKAANRARYRKLKPTRQRRTKYDQGV